MKTSIASLILLLSVTSCIKTADQVNKERQFSDSQQIVAQLVTKNQSMQSQLDSLTGKIEELEYNQSKINPDKLKENHEDIILLKTQLEAAQKQIETLTQELKVQKEYSEKVTEGLKALAQQQADAQKAAAKSQQAPAAKSAKEKMQEALQLVVDNKYISAKVILETLIDHKDLSAADRNKVLHGLGRVELYTNNPDKALVYLSKIVMNYPKSSLAPNSLYLIGKAFQKQKKTEEARQAFNKVISDYPESADAAKAKKEL